MDNSGKLLRQGLDKLNVQANDLQIAKLITYVDLIQKWNKTYNLTAIRNRDEMLSLHLLDSLAILPFITGQKIIDIGTGAGLPGIPLAIFMPDAHFTLLDSNSKKTRFVQQVVLELKLKNTEVIHSRVERTDKKGQYDHVLCRAFASLSDIIKLTAYLLNSQGVLIAMKGQQPDEELKNINTEYSLHSIKIPGIDVERCLVKIKATTPH